MQGSPTAPYRAFCYGEHSPGASFLAFLQALGAKYNAVTAGKWVLACVRLLAGIVMLYVLISTFGV